MCKKMVIQYALLVPVAIMVLSFFTGCAPKIIGRYDTKTCPIAACKVVKTVQSQLGKRYILGGTTPKGFDCSGLIWWAYRKHGICIPRVTEGQAKAGIPVKCHAVRPGDILIFKTKKGRSGFHSGLYTGNGKFIHSSTSGKHVRYDQMNNAYWKAKLYTIRRIIRK